MANYQKVDMTHWERKEHYLYYTEKLNIELNMTANIDISGLKKFCKGNSYRIYPMLISIFTKVVNEIENMRMFTSEGDLYIWDNVVPNYTIFHDDDKTFSDCWSVYCADMQRQYQAIICDMDKHKNNKGIKAKDKQPANFFCISCVPWVNFTGYSGRVTNGRPQFFPIITIGKFIDNGINVIMPVSITIAHAVCDGYHIGLFFDKLQKEADSFRTQTV